MGILHGSSQVRRIKNLGWVREGVALARHSGEWWLGTGEGITVIPQRMISCASQGGPSHRRISDQEGISSPQQVFRIFEDARGDIWASTSARRTVGPLGPDQPNLPSLIWRTRPTTLASR